MHSPSESDYVIVFPFNIMIKSELFTVNMEYNFSQVVAYDSSSSLRY